MITQARLWRKTEAEIERKHPLSMKKAQALFKTLQKQALATAPSFRKRSRSLEGLETNIRLAKAFHDLGLK